MTKKTGGLHLRRAESHGVVWLGDGLVTGGSSNLERLPLGRRLAGSGQVGDDELRAAVEQVADGSEIGLARALRDAAAIDEGELHSIVSEHIVDTVFDLMRWPDGVFEFVIDEPNVDDVGIKREVEDVVAEARRRLDSWSSIDERVASSETVLWLSLDLADEPQINRDEWALLALVDGRRTVGELATLTGRGDYAVAVALTELVERGLIRTDESEGIAAMGRRQDLIGSLETGAPAAAAAPTLVEAPVSEPEPEPVMAPEADAEVVPSEIAAAADEDTTGDRFAEITSLPARDLSAVTPQRPEPFIPSREPDHPEPLAAAIAGGGMVAAPAAAIERDPSVNKSLLLRLIAGVRGL
jgi:hypothetical protein